MKDLALQVARQLHDAGYQALWAGGCVRDMLLGLTPHDYDVATDAVPGQVRKLFPRTIAVGAQFGVIEVLGPEPGLHIQVATFRSDGSYSDGRHPDSVKFGTPHDDAERRDFTINGLFFDPLKNTVIDYIGGQDDLKKRVVRAIGNPVDRIQEDKLRMLRAIRFVSRFGFELDQGTADAIVALRNDINQVSIERITDELKKMLVHFQRGLALKWLVELQLLPVLLPMFNWQGVTGMSDVFQTVQHLPPKVSFPLAWAALLQDLQTHLRPNQPISRHEIHDTFGKRFRLSLAEIAHVEYLLHSQNIGLDAHKQPWALLKPILAHPHRDDLLTLLEATLPASSNHDPQGIAYFRERMSTWTIDQLLPPPLVTGEDVAALGIPHGPRYKQLLDAVRTEQLNETITTRQQALGLLQQLAAS